MCDPRDFKAKNEHWEIVVNYFEAYPQLLKSKFEKSDGDSAELKEIWKKLTEHLNSLGHGQKTSEKWRLAIGRWKSKVKAKTTNLKLEMERTGGGPAKSPPLTDLEERLMAVLGWRAITGDRNKELGIDAYKKAPSTEEHRAGATSNEPIPSCSYQQNEPQSSPPSLFFFFQKQTNAVNEVKEGAKEGNMRKRRERPQPDISTQRRIPKSTERSRKMVTLNHMHNETIGILKNIDRSMSSLAESVTDMKDDFKNYLNFLQNKE